MLSAVVSGKALVFCLSAGFMDHFLSLFGVVILVIAMSDSEPALASDPFPVLCSSPEAIPGSPDGVRRSSRLASLPGSRSDGSELLLRRLRDRDVVPASGLPSPELRVLAVQVGCVSPDPSPAAPVAARGQKRTRKADPSLGALAKTRGAGSLGRAAALDVRSGSSDTSRILASLQSLAGSMQSMEARLQAVEHIPAPAGSVTVGAASAQLRPDGPTGPG